MAAIGVGTLCIKLMTMLFYGPAWLYADIFLSGARAAAAREAFYRTLLESAALLVVGTYGALLSLCGTMNWRVAKASLWFCAVMAVLLAGAALTLWMDAADVGP